MSDKCDDQDSRSLERLRFICRPRITLQTPAMQATPEFINPLVSAACTNSVVPRQSVTYVIAKKNKRNMCGPSYSCSFAAVRIFFASSRQRQPRINSTIRRTSMPADKITVATNP